MGAGIEERTKLTTVSWNIEKTGGVAVVSMNSNAMNVMNEGFFSDLHEAFDELSASHPDCPVVLASSQRAFSAGLDIEYHHSLFSEGDEEKVREWYGRFRDALLRVFVCERPVMAAVNGHAVAGGLVLALCCDYRVCVDEGAKFGLNEVSIGFPLPCAMAQVVLHALGTKTGEQAVTGGLLYETETALRIGFFNEKRPAGEVLSRCVELARQYGPEILPAYSFTKRALRTGAVERIRKECDRMDGELPRILRGRQTLENLGRVLANLKEKRK